MFWIESTGAKSKPFQRKHLGSRESSLIISNISTHIYLNMYHHLTSFITDYTVHEFLWKPIVFNGRPGLPGSENVFFSNFLTGPWTIPLQLTLLSSASEELPVAFHQVKIRRHLAAFNKKQVYISLTLLCLPTQKTNWAHLKYLYKETHEGFSILNLILALHVGECETTVRDSNLWIQDVYG